MKSKEMINSLKEVFEDSTIHAIPRIIKSKIMLIKFLWFLCFLVSTGYCSYLILDAVNDYLNYEHTTQIDVYPEVPAKFPYIEFCDINVFQTDIAHEFIISYINRSDYEYYKQYSNEILINYIMMDEIDSYNDSFKRSLSSL